MTKALEVEISAFLNQYDEAFTTFDGDKIAALYCIPTITMRGDGSIHSFQSREEIARFFQGVADTYRGEGGKSGTMHDLAQLAQNRGRFSIPQKSVRVRSMAYVA